MNTILVFTDEPLMEAGLRALISENSGFRLIGCHRRASDMIREAAQRAPGLLLCALGPDFDLSLAGSLRTAAPHAAVVVLYRELPPEIAHQAMELGVRGFVSSISAPEVLLECLRTAAQGTLWMDQPLSTALLDARPVSLSRRQTQLLSLVAQGLRNKEIASALGISEGTVKTYLSALCEKVGARDRIELVLCGLKNFGNAGWKQPVQLPLQPRSVMAWPLRRAPVTLYPKSTAVSAIKAAAC